MFVRVVELYRRGVKRPNAEVKAAQPLIGLLSTWRAPNGMLVLQLHGRGWGSGSYGETNVTMLDPLFEPMLMGIKRGAMTYRGTQRDTRGSVMYEHLQVWWIRLLEDQAPGIECSDPHYHPECSKMIGDNPPMTAKDAPSRGA